MLLLLIVIIAFFVRVIRFTDVLGFAGDQGIDLLIARRAVYEGQWPLVGPFLSIDNFFVPPTYYYILSFFLWLGKTPEGVSYLFLLLNLITLVTFFMLAKEVLDYIAGIIASVIFTFSVVMVFHARSMWQPFPAQFFLIVALYMLTLAYRKKDTYSLCGSILFYAIAFSIYPSQILLLPYFIYQTIHFFWGKTRRSVLGTLINTIGIFSASFFSVYSPLIYFEFLHGFPTIKTLWSQSFGMSTLTTISLSLFMNVFMLFKSFTVLSIISERNYVLYTPLFVTGFSFAIFIASVRYKLLRSSQKSMYKMLDN